MNLFILNKIEQVVGILTNSPQEQGCFFIDGEMIESTEKASSLEFTAVLQGEQTTAIASGLKEENYVVVPIREDEARMFIIKEVEVIHEGASLEVHVVCDCASIELIDDIFMEELEGVVKPEVPLAKLLLDTRWQIGTVDDVVARTLKKDYERKTVLENINTLAKHFEMAVKFNVEFSGNRIIKRTVSMSRSFGQDRGKVFSYTSDLTFIKRTTSTDEIKTAIYPIGKEVEVGEGEDAKKVLTTIADVTWKKPTNPHNKPQGQKFLVDEEASNKYGFVKPNGDMKPRFIIMEFSDCDNPEELINLANMQLGRYTKPKVSYEMEVQDLFRITENPDFKSVSIELYDTVGIVDFEFIEPLTIKSNIVEIAHNLNNPNETKLTIGSVKKAITDSSPEEIIKDEVPKLVDDAVSGAVDQDKITAETVKAIKGEFDVLIANSVQTGYLNAILAEISTLISDKASITDLEAVNGNITNLNSDMANIKTLVNGNLTSENIQAGGITSDRLTIETGFIKDAMIENISADKIDSGEINTSQVIIKSESGGVSIADNTMQFKDKNEKVRIQIGEDANKDFTFSLFDETGTGVLIDAEGIKEKALSEGIIKEGHIGTGAVSGNKINWSSFAKEFNKETNTNTLKASKIELDGTGQKLNVAFNEMKTQVTETASKTETATTELKVQQGKIETLIANTTITKDGKTTQLKDEYNKTVDTVNSHSQTLGQHTSKLDEATGKITAVETKTNKVEKDLSGTTSTVNAHATKIGALETKTSNHETKITQNTDAIKLKASKTEVAEAVDGVKVGGGNLFNYTGYDLTIGELFNSDKRAWYKTPQMNSSIVKYSHANNKPADKFIKGKKVLYLNYDVTESLNAGVINPWGETGEEYIELKPNTEYTISGYLYSGGGSTGNLRWIIWGYEDDGSNRTSLKSTPVEPTWTGAFHRFEHTFTTDSRKNYQVRFYMYAKEGITTGNVACNLYNLKLEEGNKATAWIPSTLDTYYNVDKKITDAKAEISIETGKITTRVEDVEQLQKNGGNNLVPNSNWAEGSTEGWRITGTPVNHSLSTSAVPEDISSINLGKSTNVTGNAIWVDSPKVRIAKGTELTLSVIAGCKSNTTCRAYLLFTDNGDDISENNSFLTGYKSVDFSSTSYVKKSITDTAPAEATHCFVRLRVDKKDTANANDFHGYYNSIMLVKGDKVATWQPSQKDGYLYTNKKSAEIITTVEGISSKVNKIEGNYATKSDVTQLENSVTTTFSSTGGANMLRNSNFANGNENWSAWQSANTLLNYNISTYNKRGCRVYINKDGATVVGIQYKKELTFAKGRTYSLSFKARSYSSLGVANLTYNYILGTTNVHLAKMDNYKFSYKALGDGTYYRVTITFTPTESVSGAGLLIGASNVADSVAGTHGFGIADVMLQEGSIATEWQPHPTEVYNTAIKLDESGIRCDFDDGTYTKLGKEGFEWYKSGEKFPYHALFYTTVTNVSSNDFLTDGKGGYNWKVTLPSYFKGKVFTPMCMIQGFASDSNKAYVMMTCGIDWNSVSYAKGTYTVNCKSLNTAGSTTDYNINVVTFAIA